MNCLRKKIADQEKSIKNIRTKTADNNKNAADGDEINKLIESNTLNRELYSENVKLKEQITKYEDRLTILENTVKQQQANPSSSKAAANKIVYSTDEDELAWETQSERETQTNNVFRQSNKRRLRLA